MTARQGDTHRNPAETFKWVMHVHVSTGSCNIHAYDIPRHKQEAREAIDSIAEEFAKAFSGESVYLHLRNPSITYNVKHIVFVEHDFQGPEEWQEFIRKSFKESIGYKPKGVRR